MVVLQLNPLYSTCSQYGAQSIIAASNPIITYDVTKGNPNAQGIVPPYTNLAAHCDEVNGVGTAYVWNTVQGKWL